MTTTHGYQRIDGPTLYLPPNSKPAEAALEVLRINRRQPDVVIRATHSHGIQIVRCESGIWVSFAHGVYCIDDADDTCTYGRYECKGGMTP